MKQNYFELFQLPERFSVDLNDLTTRYRTVIARVHPDQFAHKSAVEQRMALQWATFANEAYETLESPTRRAEYLLQLHAPEFTDTHSQKALPTEFLMQQMQWREALEEGEAESVRAEVRAAHEAAFAALGVAADAQNWSALARALAEFRFIDHFLAQLPRA